MKGRFFKNDYRIKKDLLDFVNQNSLGRLLKPLLRWPYQKFGHLMPQPRDFLLRSFPKNAVGCEIGVYKGFFSERILRIAKPKKLYLIDTWDEAYTTGSKFDTQSGHDSRYHSVLQAFKTQLDRGTVEVLRTTSDKAVTNFAPNSLDFVYIDGDHSYNQVRKDLENYYPLIKLNGMLCGDDYEVHEGVTEAVKEFCRSHKVTPNIKNHQFIIYKT